MDLVRLEEAVETVVVWAGGRAWEVELFRRGRRRSVAELQEELEEIVAAGEYLVSFSKFWLQSAAFLALRNALNTWGAT